MIRPSRMAEVKRKITGQLVEELTRRGLDPKLEVLAGNAVADIVTAKAVYEVIPEVTARSLALAIERVTASRDALGGERRAVIYGAPGTEDISEVEQDAKARGVTINRWREGNHPGMS